MSPVFGPCTQVQDLEETPGFELTQFQVLWPFGDEQSFSLSLFLNSTFQIR